MDLQELGQELRGVQDRLAELAEQLGDRASEGRPSALDAALQLGGAARSLLALGASLVERPAAENTPVEPASGTPTDELTLRRTIEALEERLAERTLRMASAERARDRFLALLAHELRNPLGAILNAVTLLGLERGPGERASKPLQVIQRQVEYQTQLLDELLHVSSLRRGKISLHLERLDLVRLLRELAGGWQDSLASAGVAGELELPDGPVWISGDSDRLAQLFGNLLHNATKFTERGGRVTVRLQVRDERQRVEVEVQDTGIGIPPELLPNVFDQYSLADRSPDRSRGGLGLGLTVVKGLTELHHGDVKARSAGAGQGSSFIVSLPLARPEARHEATPRPETPAPASSPDVDGTPVEPELVRGKRILVIEDNLDAAETLRFILESSGHLVEVANSGPGGVKSALLFRPDVVLCDIGLPELDGYGVAAALRQQPGTASAKLIALSGYGQEEDRRRSLAAGFDAHLVKPASMKDLERAVEG